jgi:hypothetical protein
MLKQTVHTVTTIMYMLFNITLQVVVQVFLTNILKHLPSVPSELMPRPSHPA